MKTRYCYLVAAIVAGCNQGGDEGGTPFDEVGDDEVGGDENADDAPPPDLAGDPEHPEPECVPFDFDAPSSERLVWVETFDFDEQDYFVSIDVLADGDLIVGGGKVDVAHQGVGMLVAIGPSGEVTWEFEDADRQFAAVRATPAGGFVAGTSTNTAALLGFDANRQAEWLTELPLPDYPDVRFSGVQAVRVDATGIYAAWSWSSAVYDDDDRLVIGHHLSTLDPMDGSLVDFLDPPGDRFEFDVFEGELYFSGGGSRPVLQGPGWEVPLADGEAVWTLSAAFDRLWVGGRGPSAESPSGFSARWGSADLTTGELEWHYEAAGCEWDLMTIVPHPSGVYVLAAAWNFFKYRPGVVIAFDTSGNELWREVVPLPHGVGVTHSLVMDAAGDLYVTGWTTEEWITKNGSQPDTTDAFIAKIRP